VTETPGSRNA